MKYIVTFLLCMALAAPCFAASCQDIRDAAQLWRFRNRITPDMQVREYRVRLLCKLKRPFACFRDMVREKYANVYMDQSRLDAMTALYLRCVGYTQDEVDRELTIHTPPLPTDKEKRDSLERRTRILQYAYGPAGDIDIASYRMTDQKIRKILTDAEARRQKQREPYEQRLRPYLRPVVRQPPTLSIWTISAGICPLTTCPAWMP